MNNHVDSLETLLRYLVENQIDDDRIYSFLAQVDTGQLRAALARLDRVDSLARPAGCSAKKWNAKKRRVKGRCFEGILGVLLKGVRTFTAWNRVNTTTNEIDWLVALGPLAQISPALREWGTHFICECKCLDSGVSVTWVQKLGTVVQGHGARVGVLMSSKGVNPKGNGRRVVEQIRLYSVMNPPLFVLAVSRNDIHDCVAGSNFLRLMSMRYIQARTGAANLRLLVN